MKIKLFYKIYLVVLFSVIMSVGISVFSIGFYGYKNFRNYLAESKLQEFTWLADKLGEYYKKNGSFNAIKEYRDRIMADDPEGNDRPFFPRRGGAGDDGGIEKGMDRGGRPDGNGFHLPKGLMEHDDFGPQGKERFFPRDGLPHDLGFKLFGPPSDIDKKLGRGKNEILERIFYNDKTGINISALVRFQEFIAIIDKNKKLISGVNREQDRNEYVFTPIVSGGVTVGYLGIRKPPNFEHPLAAEFILQQLNLMLFTVVLIIIVTGLVSWIFTKKVIAPVPKLITATRKLAARDFDIDLKKETNDELGDLAEHFSKMADDLRMYENKQNRWISDISHELRTPLSVLLGSIEAMQDGVRRVDSDTMSVLHAEVQRLIKLVNELHDITMAESGGMSFDFVPVSVGDVLSDVLSLYETRCNEFGFKLETMTKHCDSLINGDIARLRQVFINILENSLKHAKSPGTIYVGCAERGGIVSITFEDSGPGVSDEQLPMLFDRLFRADSSRNRMTGGSGLGLAICKYIVQRHTGTITAMRSAMGGLKIEIDIPMEKRDE